MIPCRPFRPAALLLAAALLGACASRPAAVTYIHPDGPPANPFSPAVQVGNLVFVSGTLGTAKDGTLVPGGITAETRQVLENIKGVLAAAGLSWQAKAAALNAGICAARTPWLAIRERYT